MKKESKSYTREGLAQNPHSLISQGSTGLMHKDDKEVYHHIMKNIGKLYDHVDECSFVSDLADNLSEMMGQGKFAEICKDAKSLIEDNIKKIPDNSFLLWSSLDQNTLKKILSNLLKLTDEGITLAEERQHPQKTYDINKNEISSLMIINNYF